MNPGDLLAGRYRVAEALSGGGGVYRASDGDLTVAIKVFPSVDHELFRREAAIAARVRHPNLLRIFDVGLSGNEGWIALEYVPGMEVRAGLEGFGAMGVRRALHVAMQLFSALDAMHRRGFAHGDVNPGNLLVQESRVRLLDFGLGRFSDSSARGAGPHPGTMEYMHPSLYLGGLPTPGTDCFAAWVTTYELLVKARPYSIGVLARGGVLPPPTVQDGVLDALLWAGLSGQLDARASWLALSRFLDGREALPWVAPPVQSPPRLVGRVLAGLDAGQSMVLVGSAGLGDAALERISQARSAKGTTLQVRADWGSSAPYSALYGMIAGVVDAVDEATLRRVREVLAADRAVLAEFVPAARTWLGPVVSAEAAPAAPGTFVEAVRRLLRALPVPRTLVVSGVDGLDTSSLELLKEHVRTGEVQVVGWARSDGMGLAELPLPASDEATVEERLGAADSELLAQASVLGLPFDERLAEATGVPVERVEAAGLEAEAYGAARWDGVRLLPTRMGREHPQASRWFREASQRTVDPLRAARYAQLAGA